MSLTTSVLKWAEEFLETPGRPLAFLFVFAKHIFPRQYET
jgi:hypothetical protein